MIPSRRVRFELTIVYVAVAFLLLYDRPLNSSVSPLKPGEIWLEVPEQTRRLEANTSGQLSLEEVTFLKLHIAKSSSEIDYGTIHAKINTEAADVLMTTTGIADGIVCNLDLNRRGGFRLTPGRNSVEVSYTDRFHRLHYGSFLLDRGSRLVTPEKHGSSRPDRLAGTKYAVVVGVARYQNAGAGLQNLRFADKDADDLRRLLESPAGGSFPKQNILTLINEDATSSGLRSALFTFLSRPRPEDLVVLYFAGHGSPDPNDSRNLYFLTYDTKVDDMGGTAFPMFQFQDVFERVLKARRVITFVDSCHSFGVTGERNLGVSRNNLMNQYIQRFASTGGRAVLTASDTSELALEDTKWGGGHGVFTYYLLRGMTRDADKNHDGSVTLQELSDYLREKVTADTGGQQNPQTVSSGLENTPMNSVGADVAAVDPSVRPASRK